jgi:hypothetical protein
MILPLLFFLILISLFLYVGNTMYGKILGQISEINSLKRDNQILQNKVEGLKNYQTVSFPDSEVLLSALPKENPALLMMSRIKKIAEEFSVVVTGRTTSFSEIEKSGTFSSKISFAIEGDVKSLMNFLLKFSEVAPISTFDTVSFDIDSSGNAKGNAEMSVYFAKLPETLPDVKEAVNKLTPDEEVMVKKLSNLEAPEFTSLPPNGPFELKNPFAF